MVNPDEGNQQHGGQPPHWRTWHKKRAAALLRGGKMGSETDVVGYWKAIEPEFKRTARDLLTKIGRWHDQNNLTERLRVDEKNHWVISDLAEQPERDGNNSIHDVLKKIIYPPAVDSEKRDLKEFHLSRELRTFMDLLKSLEDMRLPYRGEQFLRYAPYLWEAEERTAFMQNTCTFTVKKHPKLTDHFNGAFEPQFGGNWMCTIPEKTIMKKVLEYKPKVKEYGGPVDAVRLWENGFKHYEQYLPSKDRGISDSEKERRISAQFPDVVPKTCLSVMTLLTVEGYLDKHRRKELLGMLGWPETDFEGDGIGVKIATLWAKLEAGDPSQPRRPVQSVSVSTSASSSASRGTSERAVQGRSWKDALIAPRKGG